MALTSMRETERSSLYNFLRDWFPLLFLLFSVGVAWATINTRVDQKLDAIRFVSDSAKMDAVNARQDAQLQEQAVELKESINRLSQLICYRSPNPACR